MVDKIINKCYDIKYSFKHLHEKCKKIFNIS
jgi:hypothetical protein